MKKWRIVLFLFLIIAVLLVARHIIDTYNLDVLDEASLIGCFIGGTLFIIAIVLAGVLSDFKESERIIDDLVVSIKNVYAYCSVIKNEDNGTVSEMQTHIKGLLNILISNFKQNTCNYEETSEKIDKIRADLIKLENEGVEPQFISPILEDLYDIEKIANRIDTIAKTSFIPASYIIADVSVAVSICLLLFLKLDPEYQGLAITGSISFVLISLICLIKDMDNPFDFGDYSLAHVDLNKLFDLEASLK